MNKKGFTLIELLMVIAIIAIISMILIPNVINMISTNKQKSCESLKKNIISATKLYVNENKYDLKFTCDNTIEIPISNLIDTGKLDGDIKNPINNDDLTTQGIIPWYMPKVTSLRYYIGKTFEDSDSLEEAVNKVATKEFKDKDLIKKWGKSYKMEELKFLEEHHAEWAEKTDCEDLVSQKFVKRICEKELAIELAKLAGKTNIDKLEDQLTKLCKEANLTPKSVTDINKNETMKIYGLWIKDIEEYRPAEYFEDKKLYQDYDGILDMFKRFILRPLKNLLTGSREFDKEFNIQKIEEELEEDKTFSNNNINAIIKSGVKNIPL